MSDQTKFWQSLADALEQCETVMLMIVADSRGSSPGKAGAKMAVPLQGECFGTIGGGPVEYALVRQAHAWLTEDSWTPRLILYEHHPSETGQTCGMICGGEQTLLLYRCRSSDRKLCRQLAAAHLDHVPGVFGVSTAGLSLSLGQTLTHPIQFKQSGEAEWCYRETVGNAKQAYLIGGGHVSLALSKILATLDYDITVIDERPNLDTLNRNTYARRQLIIPYSEIDQAVPEGDQVFVFIMTHSHKTDEQVVEQLAIKRVTYLGLLSSRRKTDQLKANLSERLLPAELEKIRAPIGLPIHSHTSAEIAISIAAELILLSNAKV